MRSFIPSQARFVAILNITGKVAIAELNDVVSFKIITLVRVSKYVRSDMRNALITIATQIRIFTVIVAVIVAQDRVTVLLNLLATVSAKVRSNVAAIVAKSQVGLVGKRTTPLRVKIIAPLKTLLKSPTYPQSPDISSAKISVSLTVMAVLSETITPVLATPALKSQIASFRKLIAIASKLIAISAKRFKYLLKVTVITIKLTLFAF